MTREWFTSKECTALEIRKHQSISVRRVVSAVSIEDSKVIQTIMARIESIAREGDMMISFGPNAECIDLLFHAVDGTTQKIEIYQRRFKTPSTGFHCGPSETEAALYADIDAWLLPAIDKVTLKVRDVELDFRDFLLTYLGESRSDPAPVSVSWVANRFLLKDRAGSSKMIQITSGQLSPPAHDFEANGKKFSLLTYKTETGQRLYPDHFQVIAHQH